MNKLALWLDNPVFVKFLRSRLRRPQVIPPGAIVLVLCLLIAYAGYELNWFKNGAAFGMYLGLQAIILGIMGSAQVSSAAGGARESGILDFHRVSPMSPTAVTLGFFLGAPVREYLLFAMILPFSLVCAANDMPGPRGLAETMVVLLLSCWLLQAGALFAALATKKPKAGMRGIIGIVVFIFLFSGGIVPALAGAAGYVRQIPTLGFFGLRMPWLVAVLLYTVPNLFFLLVASVRKTRAERAHAFSKPEAVACLATQAVLLVGGFWDGYDMPPYVLPMILVYGLVVIALIMSVTITANLGEFTKGIRRAERLGVARLSPWDDLSLNRVALGVLCLIVLAGAEIAWRVIGGRPTQAWFGQQPSIGSVQYFITDAVAVLTVASFGLAFQFFQLLSPKRGGTFATLYVFLAWGVPLVVASILGMANSGGDVARFVASLSPVFGIATSLGNNSGGGTLGIQGAAIVPVILAAFLFNNGVTVARRRAIAQVHGGPEFSKPPMPVADPLAV